MNLPRRILAPLGAFFVLTMGIAGCGDSVPGNAVVKIGDDTIKTSTFDHWMTVAATAQQQQNPQAATQKVSIPKPPEFTDCVAQKKKTAPKPAKGQPKPTDKQFKDQCKAEYDGLRNQVMQFLISSAWIQGEAADRDVKVTDADVKKDFDKQRQQSFPQEKAYSDFLKSSGYVQEDLLYRIKVQNLSNKLRDKILKGKDKVTDAEIKSYYEKNKARFGSPERRDLRIVLTKTEAKAEEAKKALDGGQDWKAVAGKFSIDQASKQNGGVLPGVGKGEQEKALDEAVFKATKGEVAGPVKTQFGYYVFEVTKVTPAETQPLNQARETVKSMLVSQNQQKALDQFLKDFRKKWKERTDCRGGFATTDCKNGPKESKTTTAPAAPQQGAPSPSGQ